MVNYICRLDITIKPDEAGIWLYTRPKHFEAWYTKLSQSSDPGTFVKNFQEATSGINEDLCLALKQSEDVSPAFELRAVQCEEKRSVICRTDSKTNASPKPSRFPCIPRIPHTRNKRASPGRELGAEGNIY